MTMLTYAQLLATLLLLIMSNSGGAAAAAQEQAGPACNVCGAEGLQVGSPDTIIELGDLLPLLPTSMTCGELQTAGEASLISVEQCLDLPNLSTACNCQEEQAPPVAPPVGCSVCGPGLRVGDPDALFESQGQPAVPCGILQEAGDFNWISEEQCSSFWADQINAICSCQEAGDEAIPDPANPSNECKACPEGYKVVNPGHAVLEGPVDNVLCGDLDDNVEGIYATDTCNLLSYFVNTACGGCMLEDDGGDAASPTVSPKRGRYHNDSLFERGYSLYIIIAAASLMVFFLGCLLYSKYVGEDGPVGPSNFTPGLAAALANANAEAEEQAKFEEEAKYRSMVLDALFPEQKCDSGTVVCSGSGDDTEADENEAPCCSICLEELDENGNVIFGSSCSHVYHRKCILEWLNKPMKKKKKYHDDCPNCRQRMWEPDTYQIVKEDIARREQRMTMSMLDEQM